MKVFAVLVVICSSCCCNTNYKKYFDRFEKAVDLLSENNAILSKYEKQYNGGNSDFIFLGGRSEFAKIVNREGNKDLEIILSLWDDKLIEDEEKSLWLLKNGNIYFQLDKCRNGYNYLVYDGGEELEVDVSEDNIKERVKSNWLYIRMR